MSRGDRVHVRALLQQESGDARQRFPRFVGDGAVNLPIPKDTRSTDTRSHRRSRREFHPRIQITSRQSAVSSRQSYLLTADCLLPTEKGKTMDCRKRMLWSLALVSGLAGCTTTGTNNTPTITNG